jgi:transcriptional regulator with XRE-family HTH domain
MVRFGELLRQYRERAGISQNALGKRTGIHPSIINRLESGEREPARREQIEALARGLGLAPHELDALLAAAGQLPAAIERLGAGHPVLVLVASVLTDERIPASERERFRAAVVALGEWLRAAYGAQPPGNTGSS